MRYWIAIRLRHLHRGANKPTLMSEDDSDSTSNDLEEYTFSLSSEDDEELIEELERAEQGRSDCEHQSKEGGD